MEPVEPEEQTTPAPTTTDEVTKAASEASIKVVNDLLDGKDLKESILDRYDFKISFSIMNVHFIYKFFKF